MARSQREFSSRFPCCCCCCIVRCLFMYRLASASHVSVVESSNPCRYLFGRTCLSKKVARAGGAAPYRESWGNIREKWKQESLKSVCLSFSFGYTIFSHPSSSIYTSWEASAKSRELTAESWQIYRSDSPKSFRLQWSRPAQKKSQRTLISYSARVCRSITSILLHT